MQKLKYTRTPAVVRWLREEVARQRKRYRQIVAQQDRLASKRDRWIADFLQRIQRRGYNVHSDQLRKIAPEEIPSRPKRRFRVVF
jgi:hypothetical protein